MSWRFCGISMTYDSFQLQNYFQVLQIFAVRAFRKAPPRRENATFRWSCIWASTIFSLA